MARNEEKQLARLNRFYLEKQKQEELKKRPPRPRLDTLNTPRELRKWLPTITRDIEFYVKQMEVTCYTDRKIDEIQERIQRLKQEYRAYLHKLRALEPDVNAASWAHRPYSQRKRHAHTHTGPETEAAADGSEDSTAKTMSPASGRVQPPPPFMPIVTPVLQHLSTRAVNQYNFDQPAPLVWKVNPDTEDQPLQFKVMTPPRTLAICCRPPATVSVGSSGIEGSFDYPENRALEFAPSSSGTDNASGNWSYQCTPSTPGLAVSQQADAGGEGCRARISFGTGRSSEGGIGSATGAPSNIGSGREGDHALQLSPSRLYGKAGCTSEDSHDRSGTNVQTSHSSEDAPRSVPSLTISGGTSAGRIKCENAPSTVGHEPSTSAENHVLDCKADLTRTTRTRVQSERLASSNPLNLGYSDSSDEDVC